MVGAGSREGALDAGNILKPVLARRELYLHRRDDHRRVRPVPRADKALLAPLPARPRRRALDRRRRRHPPRHQGRYEAHHRVRITDAALVAAVEIAARHIPDRYLPDKAIDLLDEAASQLKLEAESVPADVAAAEQALTRAEIEYRSFEQEEGAVAHHRRDWLAQELVNLRADAHALRAAWEAQKQMVHSIRELILARGAPARRGGRRAPRRAMLEPAPREIVLSPDARRQPPIEALQAQLAATQTPGLMLRGSVSAIRDVVDIAAAWTGKSSSELAPSSSR